MYRGQICNLAYQSSNLGMPGLCIRQGLGQKPYADGSQICVSACLDFLSACYTYDTVGLIQPMKYCIANMTQISTNMWPISMIIKMRTKSFLMSTVTSNISFSKKPHPLLLFSTSTLGHGISWYHLFRILWIARWSLKTPPFRRTHQVKPRNCSPQRLKKVDFWKVLQKTAKTKLCLRVSSCQSGPP